MHNLTCVQTEFKICHILTAISTELIILYIWSVICLSGIIKNGGAKPNIIPEETCLVYSVRAPTLPELNVLKKKMVACFEGAASATGCKVIKHPSLLSYVTVTDLR